MTTRTHLLRVAPVVLILAVAILLFPRGPLFHNAHASNVTIHLVAYASLGWNGTTNKNPTIAVNQGDTVTVDWSNGDTGYYAHQFLLDFDGDQLDVADCPTTDPCTGTSTTGGSVTFTASTAGSFTYYCTVHPITMVGTFVVLQPGFSMVPSPSSLTIKQGTSGTSIVTFTSENGFSGTISLMSPAVTPTGPTASLSTTSVTISPGSPQTSKLTISTTLSTPSGSYTVRVNGTSGSTMNTTTVTVTVTVPDFGIAPNPASFAVTQGSTATAMITLTSLNGFSGTITLAGRISPSGPSVSFSPASVTLSSGGSGTSTMAVSAAGGAYSSVATGNYSVNVTATNGTLTHSIIVPVTVASPTPSGIGSLPLTIIAGTAVAIIAAVGVAVYLVRRKHTTQ